MANFQFFDAFAGNLGAGNINLDTDNFAAVLSNTAFNPSSAEEIGDITQISAGNGYTTGGVPLTGVSWGQAAPGIWQWDANDFGWTATGGSLTFRYIVVYDADTDKLVGYWDAGTQVTIVNGFQFTVEVGANGIFRLGSGTLS